MLVGDYSAKCISYCESWWKAFGKRLSSHCHQHVQAHYFENHNVELSLLKRSSSFQNSLLSGHMVGAEMTNDIYIFFLSYPLVGEQQATFWTCCWVGCGKIPYPKEYRKRLGSSTTLHEERTENRGPGVYQIHERSIPKGDPKCYSCNPLERGIGVNWRKGWYLTRLEIL